VGGYSTIKVGSKSLFAATAWYFSANGLSHVAVSATRVKTHSELNNFMRLVVLLSFLLSLITFPALAQESAKWHDSYSAGAAAAQKNGKLLMVVFTGTDWIDICEIFNDEILSQPQFMGPVSEKYELVKLEYPEDNRLPKESASEMALLRDAYRVRGFPTVVMTSSKGAPFAINGYVPMTPGEYAELTLSMEAFYRERLAHLKRAEGLEGIEKAKALVKGIPELPGTLAARYYREEVDALIKADPDGTLGFTKDYQKHLADVEYSSLMQLLAKDVQWGKMVSLTDNYILEWKLEGPTKQKALLNKAGVQQKQTNAPGMVETLLQIVEINPKSPYGEEAQKRLDRLRVNNLEQKLVP